MKSFCEDELNQKYNSYFPTRVKTLDDLLKLANISRSELKEKKCLDEEKLMIPSINSKIKKKFPTIKKNKNALKILFMNLSGYFSEDSDSQERVLMEPPLGLIALLSYLNREYKERINGRIVKSRMDFDGYPEMIQMIKNFQPDIIGISVMTFYKNFVHRALNYIRKQGVKTPIFMGGPYPTGDYENVLQDENVDLCMLGEGEKTLSELVGCMLNNENKLPSYDTLKQIPGIAFVKNSFKLNT